MGHITSSEIEIVRQLFRGREDVFAVRWEKGSKSGLDNATIADILSLPLNVVEKL